MIDCMISFARRLANCRSNVKVFAICRTDCYPACTTTCQSHNKLSKQAEEPTRQQRWPESHFQAPTPLLFQSFLIPTRVLLNPTPVQSPATIDATVIQQCLFCIEAMTFVKTMQTTATAENKKWLRVRFFTNVWLRLQKQTQNFAGIDFRSAATSASSGVQDQDFGVQSDRILRIFWICIWLDIVSFSTGTGLSKWKSCGRVKYLDIG